jgi:hypothetical protein
MNIEVMVRYLDILQVIIPHDDYNITQMQAHISLNDKIQEFIIPREDRPQVWCIGCYIEGHTKTKCPILRGVEPSRGVSKVTTVAPFHGPIQYHAFQTIRVIKIMATVKFFEAMRIHLGISQYYKSIPLSQTKSSVSFLGHQFTPPNNVALWILLQTTRLVYI